VGQWGKEGEEGDEIGVVIDTWGLTRELNVTSMKKKEEREGGKDTASH